MPTLSDPGVLGFPPGVKERRLDFRPEEFLLAIETKGYRVAWSQASLCPCAGINDQTDQPNPTCALCNGSGWILFRPAGAVTDEKITGELDSLQTAIVGNDSAIIRAVMTSLVAKDVPYDQANRRMEGSANVTVRPENKLAYFDRLVNLDTTIAYAQRVKADGSLTTSLRYLIRQVNYLRSETTIFVEGTHFSISATGAITWVAGQQPTSGTILAAHYLCHPTWRISEHPHAARMTSRKFKTQSSVGNPIPLPVQGVARYEWLLL